MYLNINIEELKDQTTLSLEDIGFYSMLSQYNNQGITSYHDIFKTLPISEFKNKIEQFKTNSLLEYNFKEDNQGDLIFEISSTYNSSDNEQPVNLNNDNKLLSLFKLTELQFNGVKQNEIQEDAFKVRLSQIALSNFVSNKDVFEINSEQDYIDFLKKVGPLDILSTSKSNLTVQDFITLYELNEEFNFDISILSLAYDYAIKNSDYNMLSKNYVTTLLSSWHKKGFKEVEQCIKYLTSKKEEIKKKYSNYQEPEYSIQEPTSQDENISLDNLRKGWKS